MPFQRLYTREEVHGMIQIFEGSRPIRAINPLTHRIDRQRNASHPGIHGGASYLDQRTRVNTPGEPRTTGTYWTQDDQIEATLNVINSHLSQIQLRQFDTGATRVALETDLPVNRYRIEVAHDDSDLGAGVAGHVGRNNAGRLGAGSTHAVAYARRGFVLLLRGVGRRLQIQTAFPIL